MRKIMIAIMLGLMVLLTVWPTGCNSSGPKAGEAAPDFQLNNLNNETVSLSDFRGKTVLLNFWATWCGYCREEMPYLQEIHDEWEDRGVVILAVDVGESASKVEAFMQTYHLSLMALLDSNSVVAEQYRISGYPTTYFIDKDGIIRDVVVGAFPNKNTIEYYLEKTIP